MPLALLFFSLMFSPKGKADIMQCLVAAIEADMLDIDRKEGQPDNVSPACKAELKFELLQKHSNVKLNPSIVSIFSPK